MQRCLDQQKFRPALLILRLIYLIHLNMRNRKPAVRRQFILLNQRIRNLRML